MIDPTDNWSWFQHAQTTGLEYYQEIRPLYNSKMPPAQIIANRIAVREQRLMEDQEKVAKGTAKQQDYDDIE